MHGKACSDQAIQPRSSLRGSAWAMKTLLIAYLFGKLSDTDTRDWRLQLTSSR